MKKFLKSYAFIIFMLIGIVAGCIAGAVWPKVDGVSAGATVLEPLGTLFINMMFCIVVPMVFFSISSAIANMDNAALYTINDLNPFFQMLPEGLRPVAVILSAMAAVMTTVRPSCSVSCGMVLPNAAENVSVLLPDVNAPVTGSKDPVPWNFSGASCA